MADIANDKASGSFLAALGAPFIALNALLASIAEANAQIRRVNELNLISDSELAARGTTREAEIRRAFGVPASL